MNERNGNLVNMEELMNVDEDSNVLASYVVLYLVSFKHRTQVNSTEFLFFQTKLQINGTILYSYSPKNASLHIKTRYFFFC